MINPNTSAHITERMAASARTTLIQGDVLTAITAVDGPAVVRSAVLLAQADVSAMALADTHASQHDAIVLGISLDGVAPRLRQHHPELPIVGMTEAALLTACLQCERIGLLTLGASLLPLYRQRV
ncbi:MAG: aspartate/glutamate racemase family protein, partial [Rubrivivax sp.]